MIRFRRSLTRGTLVCLVLACVLGRSPVGAAPTTAAPVPTRAPEGDSRCGDHPWCDTSLSPDARAELLVEALTPDERIGLLAGDSPAGTLGLPTTHTGASDGVPRLDVPPLFQTDGPMGVRQGPSTALPASIALAASFDRDLARTDGGVVGDEAKHKGNDLVFGPTVNMLRTPLWGRSFETYGEDPYLTTRMGVEWIKGLQAEGVMANVKHFAANNQEGAAVPTGIEGNRFNVDVRVDERTLREIYLPQFEAAVKEGKARSVMCSYNKVNGEHSCENWSLLTDILRKDWGFKGFVLADYGASKHVDTGLDAGLDYEPYPYADTDGGENLTPATVHAALDAGRIDQGDVDTAVGRLLSGLFGAGFFDRADYANDDSGVDKDAHDDTATSVAEAGTVLLQNDGTLPLDTDSVDSLAVIGADADRYVNGGGSSAVAPYRFTSVKDGITARSGDDVEVSYDPGIDAERAATLAARSDVALVVVSDSATEGIDKACLSLDCPNGADTTTGQRDALIEKVAAANPHTVVVLMTGSPVLTPWRDSVAAIVEGWYPGQAAGTAMAAVLFGDVDPGGRLPATFPASADDRPTAGDVSAYPGRDGTVQYREGVLMGYRWFDAKRVDPAFAFGHGLSYTEFQLGPDLRIAPRTHDRTFQVSIEVTNTGSRAGVAVPQLYLGLPGTRARVQPPRQLKGFDRVELRAGETRRVTFELHPRDISYWDATRHRWEVADGCYRIAIGQSSRDIDVHGAVAVGTSSCPDQLLRLRTDLTEVRTVRGGPDAFPDPEQDSGPSPWIFVAAGVAGALAIVALLLWLVRRARPASGEIES